MCDPTAATAVTDFVDFVIIVTNKTLIHSNAYASRERTHMG